MKDEALSHYLQMAILFFNGCDEVKELLRYRRLKSVGAERDDQEDGDDEGQPKPSLLST
jgi:hypothetical protein